MATNAPQKHISAPDTFLLQRKRAGNRSDRPLPGHGQEREPKMTLEHEQKDDSEFFPRDENAVCDRLKDEASKSLANFPLSSGDDQTSGNSSCSHHDIADEDIFMPRRKRVRISRGNMFGK